MDDHLGYEKSGRSDSDDHRNGYNRKRVNEKSNPPAMLGRIV